MAEVTTEAQGVEVQGVAAMDQDFHQLTTDLDRSVDDLAYAEAQKVAQVGAARVPFITGELAGSITVAAMPDGAEVYSDVVYFGPVEWGGWPPSRPYIPEGRYVAPVASDVVFELPERAELAVDETVEGFAWTYPS